MNKFFSYCFIVCCISILFSCQKEVSVETYSALTASGSLWDSAGACLPDSVYGTFYDGVVPGSDTAYVEIQVNVTQTGSYNISSNLQDGFLFADSGFFSSTGINIVRLKPIGIPIIPTTAIFNISFDSSFCSFSLNIQDSTGTGLGGHDTAITGDLGDWQFTTDSGGSYHGNFAYVQFFPDSVIPGYYDLGMTGFTNDTAFTMVVLFPNNQITTGTFYSQPPQGSNQANCYMGFANATSGETIFSAIAGYPPNINFSITISSYDPVTRIVKGTFSGTALIEKYYDQGTPITIQNGSFTATVSP